MLEFIYSTLAVLGILFSVVMLIKNYVTYKNRSIIEIAIFQYRIDMIDNNKAAEVDYDDMESYDKTLWRIYDWGLTNILPVDKIKIIKPYIDEIKKNNK